MKNQLVLRVVAKFLIPFILMFALYVQMHGEYSPGGGFQAGVIFASAFILYSLIFGLSKATRVISIDALRITACFGVLIYGGTGVASLLLGRNFLNYSAFAEKASDGQVLGITIIELGVGITVYAVMLLLFFVFAARKD